MSANCGQNPLCSQLYRSYPSFPGSTTAVRAQNILYILASSKPLFPPGEFIYPL